MIGSIPAMRVLVFRSATLVLCIALAGCAGVATRESGPGDPFESLNRVVFRTNEALDNAIIRPVAEAYRAAVSAFVRDRIRSAIDNLAEPRIFVNDLLQGRINAAGITFTRFLVNTFAGLGGAFDLATGQGLPRQTGDFGQTLYAWGADSGPYLVLLFFGPSNLRDAFGLGVDLATTPPLAVHGRAAEMASAAVGVVDGIDLRARNIETLDEIKADALDFYSRMRSLWQQQRMTQLRDARAGGEEPDELLDPGASEARPND